MAKSFMAFFDAPCHAVYAFGPDGELLDGTGGTTAAPCGSVGLRMRVGGDGKWYIERGAGLDLWWKIPAQTGSDLFALVFKGSLIASRIWYYEGGARKFKPYFSPNEAPTDGDPPCTYEICEMVGPMVNPLDADKAYAVTTSCTWVKVLTKWYCL